MNAKKNTNNVTSNNVTNTAAATAKPSVYERVTAAIIAQLEEGVTPWEKPWVGMGGACARSFATGRPYSLLNQMLLARPGYYMSFAQAKAAGGRVKKGAHGTPIVSWAREELKLKVEAEGEDGKKEQVVPSQSRFRLVWYYVFHADDVEGVTPREEKPIEVDNADPIEEAERVITDYLTREEGLRFMPTKGDTAYYSVQRDEVVVPLRSQFRRRAEYYSTAFHELTHSTLIPARCNRRIAGERVHFGDCDYSKEELIAELGAAMLMASVGIECKRTRKNSAAYLKSWIDALKADAKMIVYAASGAEKAARYILGAQAEA